MDGRVKIPQLRGFDMNRSVIWQGCAPGAVAMVALLLIGGCSSKATKSEQDTEAFALKMIAEKVAVAADANRDYVAILNEDQILMSKKQALIDTDQIDVDYYGNPQELLQTLAVRYGYKYVETGKRVTLKPISVRVFKTAPVEVMRDIGYQVDNGADLVLDKNERVVRLTYKPITGTRG